MIKEIWKNEEKTYTHSYQIYVTSDGKEFKTLPDRKEHEQEIAAEKCYKMRIPELDDVAPLTWTGEEIEAAEWYKIKNRAEFDMLCEAFEDEWSRGEPNRQTKYPIYICIIDKGYDYYHHVWFDCELSYIREFLNHFNIDLDTFQMKIPPRIDERS